MNPPPFDHLNSDSGNSANGNGDRPHSLPENNLEELSQDASEVELARLRQESREATTRTMKRLYLILLAIGLAIGAVVSVGVVTILNRFDLSDPPAQDFDINSSR